VEETEGTSEINKKQTTQYRKQALKSTTEQRSRNHKLPTLAELSAQRDIPGGAVQEKEEDAGEKKKHGETLLQNSCEKARLFAQPRLDRKKKMGPTTDGKGLPQNPPAKRREDRHGGSAQGKKKKGA